jgi:hypothetical protein
MLMFLSLLGCCPTPAFATPRSCRPQLCAQVGKCLPPRIRTPPYTQLPPMHGTAYAQPRAGSAMPVLGVRIAPIKLFLPIFTCTCYSRTPYFRRTPVAGSAIRSRQLRPLPVPTLALGGNCNTSGSMLHHAALAAATGAAIQTCGQITTYHASTMKCPKNHCCKLLYCGNCVCQFAHPLHQALPLYIRNLPMCYTACTRCQEGLRNSLDILQPSQAAAPG